jgi:ferredoxin-NADP reductase
VAGSIDWRLATVAAIHDETPSVRTFTLAVSDWPGHRAGQHLDLRLTAEDGYSVERSYSIATGPERGEAVDITVERIADGEVSPFLHDVVVPGDRIEVRGPIGGYFVWEAAFVEPLLLIAGGSGIVPLMAMLRHRTAAGTGRPARLLASWRGPEEIIYRDELDALDARDDGLAVIHTLTRVQPPDWTGYRRRIDGAMLAEVLKPLGRDTRSYICGPTNLVEGVADALVGLGLAPDRIRTERFGPTGA